MKEQLQIKLKQLRITFFALVIVVFAGSVYAQSPILQGLIMDAKNGQPLPDVEILIKETGKGSVSDRFGMFYFKSLPAGSYTLEVTHLGYAVHTEKVQVKTGELIRLKISLNPSVKELAPVEIREQQIDRVPYIRDNVLREEIERASARDIGDIMRQEPNVAAIRKGGIALDPVVRGFKYGQLNVQADYGLKIEGGCPNRMDPTSAHIEIEDIERIEIVKGPYALRYGPAMGGVVNLITTHPEPYEDFEVHVHGLKAYESNWNGNKEYLSVRGGAKRYFFQLSGSKKEFGNYEDGNGKVIPSAFSRYSYKAQLGLVPLKGHQVLFAWENSKGRNVDYPALPMDERTDDTRLYSLDYKASDLGKVLHSIDVKLYRSEVDHVMDNTERAFSDTVAAVSTLETFNQGFRAQGAFNLGSGHLIAGVDYEDIYKDGDRVKNLIMQATYPIFTEQLWNEASITNLGFFAEYRRMWEKMELISAFRLDMNKGESADIQIMKMGNLIYFSDQNNSEHTNFSVSAGLSREITESIKLSIALGRGVRSPDMLERFIILLPIGYDRFDYLGNPALKPEANHQLDLTLDFANPTLGSVKLNAFYSYITDYITGKRIPPTEQMALTADVLGVKQFYNAETATMKGFEFSYHTPAQLPLKVSLIASYTHGTVGTSIEYVKNENGEITGEVELSDDAMAEIPPFEAGLNVSWPLFGGQLIPRASFRLVSAQKHISASYEEDETPGFSVIDLGLNYRFNEFITLSGGVNNVLDEAYYEHLNRRIIGSKGNFYEPGRIFFINLVLDI